MSASARRALLGTALMISPLVTSPAYLWLSYGFSALPGVINSAAVVLVLALGLTGLVILPLPRWVRAAASPFYGVGMLVMTVIGMFVFPCVLFARCL